MTLQRGTDFDDVVFGISLGSISYLCQELLEADPKWQAMVDKVETTRTMAFQAWLNKSLQELGWNDKSPIMDAYVEPMDTWADMSQLIGREDYPPSDNVANIAYFCGPMEGGTPPASETGTPEGALKIVENISNNCTIANLQVDRRGSRELAQHAEKLGFLRFWHVPISKTLGHLLLCHLDSYKACPFGCQRPPAAKPFAFLPSETLFLSETPLCCLRALMNP